MLISIPITFFDTNVGLAIYVVPAIIIVSLSIYDSICLVKDYRKFKANCKVVDATIAEVMKKRETGDTSKYKLVPTGEKILHGTVDLMKVVEDKDEPQVAAN